MFWIILNRYFIDKTSLVQAVRMHYSLHVTLREDSNQFWTLFNSLKSGRIVLEHCPSYQTTYVPFGVFRARIAGVECLILVAKSNNHLKSPNFPYSSNTKQHVVYVNQVFRSYLATAMDDAKRFVGSRHLPDRTAEPVASQIGPPISRTDSKRARICFSLPRHDGKRLEATEGDLDGNGILYRPVGR